MTVLIYFRLCYFRTNKALSGGVTPFLEDLNKTFGSGVFTSDSETQELKCFLKWLIKNSSIQLLFWALMVLPHSDQSDLRS
jgi:hypothetical protein